MELGAPSAEEQEADEGAEGSKRLEEGVRSVPLGSRVFYTADEVRSFRTIGLEPGALRARSPSDDQLTPWLGIKLLGFKSRKDLAFEDNIKHSLFIYPDEMVRLPLRICAPLQGLSSY